MPHSFGCTAKVVHYLLTKRRFAVGDGLVDLRRMLWYIDVTAALELGAPLTAFTYIKREDGPAAIHFAWVMGRLQSSGVLGGGGADYLAYCTAYLNPIRLADMSEFSNSQVEIIDKCFSAVSVAGYGGGRLADDSQPEHILSMTRTGDFLVLPPCSHTEISS